MESCLYEGWVRHRRFSPVKNSFTYSLFMVLLDLSELDTAFLGHPLWSGRRPSLAYFRRADHVGDPDVDLDRTIRDLAEEKTGIRPAGPIRLLTHLRYFGHCMNPVSFYYCYDRAGKIVEIVVAEVHNTPWNETHCYVLRVSEREGAGTHKRFRFSKEFHVSPFMGMRQDYDWRFVDPGSTLTVHMENLEDEHKILDATMVLRRRTITRRRLTLILLRHPFMTLKVVAAIYWQALRLWLRRCPFHPHPGARPEGHL